MINNTKVRLHGPDSSRPSSPGARSWTLQRPANTNSSPDQMFSAGCQHSAPALIQFWHTTGASPGWEDGLAKARRSLPRTSLRGGSRLDPQISAAKSSRGLAPGRFNDLRWGRKTTQHPALNPVLAHYGALVQARGRLASRSVAPGASTTPTLRGVDPTGASPGWEDGPRRSLPRTSLRGW